VLRHIRLLIFDLDYLVYDSAALKVKALRQCLISFADAIPQNLRLPDAVDIEEAFRAFGYRWFESLDLGLGDLPPSLIDAYRIHEHRLIEAGAGQVYPALKPVLNACKRDEIRLALGADAARDYLLEVSDRHGLDDLFDVSLCAAEFGMGSVAEMLEEVVRLAEVNRSEAIVLGTRPEYFRVARELDLTAIGCGWGTQRQEFMAEAEYQCLAPAGIFPAVLRADELAARDY
jgi:phosphoglycolate phosphatase-like HAD superfamily hydrolase